jgi:RecB family exonuclease
MKPTQGRTLICGDFPDLEAAFIERVRELKRADPLAPLFVLVPTNLLRRHLSRVLAERGVPHLNVRFVTFSSLVRDLIAPSLLTDGHVSMPKFADELLMAEACDGQGDEFYFAKLSDRPGLHGAILSTIQDLKEAGADVAGFESALKRIEGVHPTARAKLTSLLAVWQRYEELKAKHRFLDEADQHARATELVGQRSLLDGAAELMVYGVYDFKRMQARLVLVAAEQVSTTVYFPYESTPVWAYARPSLELLERAGFVRHELPKSSTGRSERLQRLCDRLFASGAKALSGGASPNTSRHIPSPPPPLPADGERGEKSAIPLATTPLSPSGGRGAGGEGLPVQIVSVPGETREAQELPRIVWELAQKHGIPFADVSILLRSAGGTERSVREAFDQAGLPVNSPAGRALAETAAGRSLLLLLRVLDEDFARRDVMELFTFANLDFASLAGTDAPPTAVWDAMTMRAKIVRSPEQWLRRLASLRARLTRDRAKAEPENAEPNAVRADDDPAIVDSLIRAVRKLFDLLQPIIRSRNWSELVERTVDAFTKLIRPSEDRDDVLRAINELNVLESLKPGPDRSLLGRLVEAALQNGTAAQATRVDDGTVLTALMQARGLPFRAVIVPGLIERVFPQPPSLDPILLDHERVQLNTAFAASATTSRRRAAGAASSSPRHALAPQLPEKADQTLEERLLFRLAIGAARERLVLTFPRIEAESARERVPSYFLLRTLDALGEPRVAVAAQTLSQSSLRVAREVLPPRGAVAPGRPTPKKATRSHAPNQLALPFFEAPPAASTGESSAAQPAAPAPEPPANFEALQKWPGFRRERLAEFAPRPERAVSLQEFDLGSAIGAHETQPAILTAFASVSPHFARGITAETVRWSKRYFTRFDGRVDDAELLDRLRARSPLRSPISPSRIEDYSRCPFHFCLHNLLRLEDLEEPEELSRSDPIAKGQLVHRILAEFLAAMKQANRLPLTSDCEADLLAIAADHLKEFEESGAAGPELTWRIEREQLEQFFRDFIANEIAWQHERGFRPAHFELPFGRDDVPAGLSKDPARVDLGNGQTLQFRGVIDRVDIRDADQAICIIDYKGRQIPRPGKDGFGLGKAVQLPIYFLGAQAALRPVGQFSSAGGRYISYATDVAPLDIRPLDDESNARLLDQLRTIAEGIHAGLFVQYTGQDACKFCPYDRVCMGLQDTMVELKRGDRAAADFLEMKGKFRLAPNAESS